MGRCAALMRTLQNILFVQPDRARLIFLCKCFSPIRMKFGFVTFKSAKDAYNTIDGSSADSTINTYDISFGGRRAFCKESYLDLGKAKKH